MNAATIDALIAQRNLITDRRDIEALPYPDTSAIDAVLAEVPPGEDNRVDLLLGRPGAVLPKRVDYKIGWFVSQAVTLSDPATQALIDKTRKLWRDAQAIEY